MNDLQLLKYYESSDKDSVKDNSNDESDEEVTVETKKPLFPESFVKFESTNENVSGGDESDGSFFQDELKLKRKKSSKAEVLKLKRRNTRKLAHTVNWTVVVAGRNAGNSFRRMNESRHIKHFGI